MGVGEDGIYRGDVSAIQHRISHSKNVIAYARSSRIIRIRVQPELLVYMGRERDHVIVDNKYCSCMSFILSIGSGELKGCKHMAALAIAGERGWVVDASSMVDAESVSRIVWEVLTGEFTMTLRRILHKNNVTI